MARFRSSAGALPEPRAESREPDIMQIEGQTFLVSGGASGLGRAVVELLATHGGQVVIADVNETAGKAVASAMGECARFVSTDVTSEADVQRAVAAATETFGGLQGAISAAGIGTAEKLLGKVGSAQPRVVRPYHHRSISSAPSMSCDSPRRRWQTVSPNAAGERGVLINTASVAAFDGQIGQVAYSASKGGIVAHDPAGRAGAGADRAFA